MRTVTPWFVTPAVGRAGVVAAISALAAAGCARPTPAPVVLPQDRYQQLVSAFFTGVASYQAGDFEEARERFRASTTLAPDEPAAWANHALVEIHFTNLDQARSAIAKARELAPESSDVALLAAQIAASQGETDEAQVLLRQSIAADAANARARYALVQELDRQSGAAADTAAQAEARTQLEAIVEAHPDNLVALFDLARLAAKSGDRALVQRTLGRLTPLAGGWDGDTRKRLGELQSVAGTADPRDLTTRLVLLRNLLLSTPDYKQSVAALQSEASAIAEPLERFLRIENPSARPAEADMALKFAPAPASYAGAAWSRALDLMPDGPPSMMRMDVARRGLTVGQGTLIPFPLLSDDGARPPPPESVAAIDWNNDQRPDLALAGTCGLFLFEQTEPGQWSDVTEKSGLLGDITGGCWNGVWPVDVDLEGDLDLILGAGNSIPAVLRNNGDGTWGAWTPLVQGGASDHDFQVDGIHQLAWADLDGDADADVALIDGHSALHVFDNERAGRYRRVATGEGAALALSVADANLDGRLDVVALRKDGAIERRTWRGGDDWERATIAEWDSVPPDGSARLLLGDLDNNGAPDLVASGSRGSGVWLAGVDGKLKGLYEPPKLDMQVLSLADLDGDGKLDLAGGPNAEGVTAMLNKGGSKAYHWQTVRPRGLASIVGDQRINSFGVGGDAMLRAGLVAQLQPITGPTLHFGLGDQALADVVRIRWPSGISMAEFDLGADTVVKAEQRLKGSCPWLFANNGTSVAFVTDILWRSPLGLRINAQATAGVVQTRDWVNVRRDQLAPVDGRYDLRITAELWETHYFDHVALMTVDHPAGSEVFVDERFAIPPPPLEVQVTGPVAPIPHAADQTGRDVTGRVAALDGAYLDTFDLGRFQGVAAEHFVEVELPQVTDRSVLVAQGWIYPTDSSINVALGQGRHDPPRDLSIEVPDGRGGWRVARDHAGFPAGKNKTLLVDLAPLFPPPYAGPRAIRLRTNMEIYWDRLGVAERRPAAALRRRTLPADVADLRYRGFSATSYTDDGGNGQRRRPEVPDYVRLMATAQIWPDLVGLYTRFGDVTPLLAVVDDRYVIVNAGDEIALQFPAPAAPPAGWVRDFVFVSDGWEKDGDLNTSYSKTVQPLPSHDRPEYAEPWHAGPVGRLVDDPVYQAHAQDWVDYHTRYVTAERFRWAVWPGEQ